MMEALNLPIGVGGVWAGVMDGNLFGGTIKREIPFKFCAIVAPETGWSAKYSD
jgi:hypothetical protein